MLAALATTLFIALFAFGSTYFGWSDPGGEVSLALFASFLFGIVAGLRVRN